MAPLGRLGMLPPELRRNIFEIVFEDRFSGNEESFVGPNAITLKVEATNLDTSEAVRAGAKQSYLRRLDAMVDAASESGDELRRDVAHVGIFDDYRGEDRDMLIWLERNMYDGLRRFQRWRQAQDVEIRVSASPKKGPRERVEETACVSACTRHSFPCLEAR